MATNNGTAFYTVLDIAKGTNELGEKEPLLDIVLRRNGLFEKLIWSKANRPESHRFQLATSVSASSKVGVDEGIPHDKVTRQWFEEDLAMFRKRSTIAKDSQALYGTTVEAFLNEEDQIKVKQVLTDFMTELVYGNLGTDPKGFNGFYQRMGTLTTVANLQGGSYNTTSPVLGAAGSSSGTMSSIILVQLGTDRTFAVHGKGSKAMGIQVEDMTKDTPIRLLDGSSNPYYGFEHIISLDAGLVVRNPRSIGRVANIDLATSDVINANKVIRIMYQVMAFMTEGVTTYAMCSPNLYAFLKDYAFTRQNILVSIDEFGHEFPTFGGVTWLKMDTMLDTDVTVS